MDIGVDVPVIWFLYPTFITFHNFNSQSYFNPTFHSQVVGSRILEFLFNIFISHNKIIRRSTNSTTVGVLCAYSYLSIYNI